MRRSCFSLLVSVLWWNGLAAWGQQLAVQVDNGQPVVLNRSDIDAMPHVKVTVNNLPDPATFEGVLQRC